MSKNADKPINPTGQNQSGIVLTKREYFAGLAMQGLCADSELNISISDIARLSVKAADALLRELENPEQ